VVGLSLLIAMFPFSEKTLLRRSRLLAFSKPPKRDVTSLANWIDGVKPTVEEESHFLEPVADLVPLSVQESNPLEDFLATYCYKMFVTTVCHM
jgi:hypothetical protein